MKYRWFTCCVNFCCTAKWFSYTYTYHTYIFHILFLYNLLQDTEYSYTVKETESEVAQSCPTLCDPMDCSLPGFSVHGIFQARVLECVAISFSRVSSRCRYRTRVSHVSGRHFTIWAKYLEIFQISLYWILDWSC